MWCDEKAKKRQSPEFGERFVPVALRGARWWLEFAGLENDGLEHDGVEQQQTYILHTMKNFNVYDM